jgi:hypothetical protein
VSNAILRKDFNLVACGSFIAFALKGQHTVLSNTKLIYKIKTRKFKQPNYTKSKVFIFINVK